MNIKYTVMRRMFLGREETDWRCKREKTHQVAELCCSLRLCRGRVGGNTGGAVPWSGGPSLQVHPKCLHSPERQWGATRGFSAGKCDWLYSKNFVGYFRKRREVGIFAFHLTALPAQPGPNAQSMENTFPLYFWRCLIDTSRIHRRTVQKKIFTTQIITMVWSLT